MVGKSIILITVVFNIIGIILNGNNFFMGNAPTYLDCAFSIFYVLLWGGLSAYTYIKKDVLLSKFQLNYWIIGLAISIISAIITIVNYNKIIIPSMYMLFCFIFFLFDLIFFAPFYGLRLFLNLNIVKYSIVIIIIPMVFTILAIGVFKKLKKDTI
ncbi:hypothetical protein [Clostridium kluyveri]|uniref:Uncharacterized protein n=1 Tax=Clostridium kluyveri TaxID=1534 RepID=A0A1L5F517_CLOKL|nr:hypothetical protein [Clostridium kluyveri]APM37940.1 hypothetical protein BS101_03910 [Clostridium kluyveri]UZQ52051.1 hypothetical protein OP486_07810 [Clostridium kluyveri]